MGKHAPWKPGESGNPGGRPKGSIDFSRRAREKLSDPEEFTKLWKRAQKSDYLMRTMMEYAFGKPSQAIQVSGAVEHTFLAIGGDQEAYVGALEHLRTWPQPSTIPH